MKAMETIQDLIEEAKVRMVWWALCIFAVTYFLSHTSSSMWLNLPISILLVSAFRILSNEVEFSWKSYRLTLPQSYLSHLEKKQLSVNDSRLSSAPLPQRWKRKIDSPVVEAAINDLIDKVLKDFVIDLWYSEITPDKEAPELMRAVILDAIGEISGRVKEINLLDLLTRDIIDLIGDHLDLFRRNQALIGADVMETLSIDERDDRLKHHLMASKELHPALISPECEYKVLQRLVGGFLTVLLRPRESQCPLVRTIARELVTCLILQPVMGLASPLYINQIIEYILLAIKDGSLMEVSIDQSGGPVHDGDSSSRKYSSLNSERTNVVDNEMKFQGTDMNLAKFDGCKETLLDCNSNQQETLLACNSNQHQLLKPHYAEWARVLEAATQRRTEVLTPENLENMWSKGRNYKKKESKNLQAGVQQPTVKGPVINNKEPTGNAEKEIVINSTQTSAGSEEKAIVWQTPRLSHDALSSDVNKNAKQLNQDQYEESSLERAYADYELNSTSNSSVNENKSKHKRSYSTSALKAQPIEKKLFTGDGGVSIISEFNSPDYGRPGENLAIRKFPDAALLRAGSHGANSKLKCRVMGAYFEKLGSNSFAVYSIAVTDAQKRTWFVKRRYRNFERLHRHLKEIPNYTLHLPPKRIFSSSTEDSFVHQRCIQLDKYLQDLLAIANVAEQHEVWDFLSVSSKNYSFGKSSSVMRTLAVNVDDAVDDIVRQFKGVSDGLMRKVVGLPSPLGETDSSIYSRNLSWHEDEINKPVARQDTSETANSISDNEERFNQETHRQEEESTEQANGWHSDNELNSKGFPPRVIKHDEESFNGQAKCSPESKSEWVNQVGFHAVNSAAATSNHVEDPVGMPPEWTPPNVSVPLLNLVDKVFQLKRRGWLRRQVFWVSKQILQLIMEDAIDDWLLRQIHWLRSEDIVAQGIRWVQDALWPDGTFFTKIGVMQDTVHDAQLSMIPFQASQLGGSKASKQSSFEEQLEAARRASDIKKMLFDGVPTALVSLIGNKQYKRCARDIFYFTQSTVCVKQLAYSILELLLISVFPELRDLVLDVHGKMLVLRA